MLGLVCSNHHPSPYTVFALHGIYYPLLTSLISSLISHLPEFANTLQPYTPLPYLLMPRTRMDKARFFSRSFVPSFPLATKPEEMRE
jgi:hypothetical protein